MITSQHMSYAEILNEGWNSPLSKHITYQVLIVMLKLCNTVQQIVLPEYQPDCVLLTVWAPVLLTHIR